MVILEEDVETCLQNTPVLICLYFKACIVLKGAESADVCIPTGVLLIIVQKAFSHVCMEYQNIWVLEMLVLL